MGTKMLGKRSRTGFYPPSKRYKSGNTRSIVSPRAEIKWTNVQFNAATLDYYLTLTEINTGGEYDKRIGNNIHVLNAHVQMAVKASTTQLGAFRVMLVQSKQGMLSGGGGSADAPTFQSDANHNAYKVFWDKIYSFQYGDDEQAEIIDFKVKINQSIRYKYEPTSDYACDKLMYLWLISQSPAVQDLYAGRVQIYYSDV